MPSLPIYELKTREENGQVQVWDPLRKRYILLTPEEHVRQCLIAYLNIEKSVPTGLISIERGLDYHGRRKRYDLLVYDREGQPLICCECKAPYVLIDEKAAFQLATYNSRLGAPYLLLTNGSVLRFFAKKDQGFEELAEIPLFTDLIAR